MTKDIDVGGFRAITEDDLKDGEILKRDGWEFEIHFRRDGKVYYRWVDPSGNAELRKKPIADFIAQFNAGPEAK